MKKKKLLIITWSFILLLFIIPSNFYFMQKQNVEEQIQLIPDDQIVVKTNPRDPSTGHLSLTKEDQVAIESIEGINDIEYGDFNQFFEYNYAPTVIVNYYQAEQLFINIKQLNENIKIDQELNYLYGHAITKDNGAVISEDIANDLLMCVKCESYKIQDLIGQTIDINEVELEIEGIFKQSKLNTINTQNQMYGPDDKLIEQKIYENGFFTYADLGDHRSIEDEVESWNDNIAHYSNVDGVNNYDLKVYKDVEYIDEYGNKYINNGIDYQKSVDNGVVGMINPENVNQVYEDYYPDANITLSIDADKNYIVSELEKIENIDLIISNQLTFLDVTNHLKFIIIFLITYLIITLILITKYLKSKSDFINAIIISTILVLITQVIAVIIGYNFSIMTCFIFITLNIIIILIIYFKYLIQKNKQLTFERKKNE